MKTILYIFLAVIALSSCTGTKFLSRKYTAGAFRESQRSIKHNTIKVENNNIYASMNSTLDLKKSNIISEALTEKEIIESKVNSIIKKDSILHIKCKGKNMTIIQKNKLPNITVTLDEKDLSGDYKNHIGNFNKTLIKKAKKESYLAISLCLIPILGFIISVTAIKHINLIRKIEPNNNLSTSHILAGIALFLSSIISFLFIAFVALVVLSAAYSAGISGR